MKPNLLSSNHCFDEAACSRLICFRKSLPASKAGQWRSGHTFCATLATTSPKYR
jgi:hypothetical protein